MLKDHLNGDITNENPTLDLDEVQRLASNHQLSGFLYFQCHNWLKKEQYKKIYSRLQQYYSAQLVLHASRQRCFDKLKQQMIQQKIPFAPFKGGEIAQYYPFPNLRSASDIDVLVHTQDREKVQALLEAEGFKTTTSENGEWWFEKGKIVFEVHNRLLFDVFTNTQEGIAFCDRCWEFASADEGSSQFTLDPGFHLIYMLLHIRKHIMYHGIGLRQFLDLAVILRRIPDAFNWKWISENLDSLNLLRFAQTCFALCENWFDVRNPLGNYTLADDFYKTVTDTIFANGVFGNSNAENEVAGLTHTVAESKLPYLLEIIKITMGNLFPSYNELCAVPYYSFLKHRPWLLPFTWIYRLIIVIKHKFGYGKEVLIQPIGKRDAVEARTQMLNDWGL